MPDHGRLFDQFSASATHSHGGSYFDAGFGLQTIRDAHGALYDLFGVPQDSDAKGQLYDEFGWESMPAIHGQYFDSDFRLEAAGTGEHGTTWFDVFRGGTQARFMEGGRDFEGTVIRCEREFAVVRDHSGQEHEVGLSQFLAFRTPNEQQGGPGLPGDVADSPSAHSDEAHGAFDGNREEALNTLPSPIGHVSEGPGNTNARSGLPDGLMDVYTRLKSKADEMDVEKISVGGKACPHCGHDTFKIPPAGSAKTVTCNGCGAAHEFSAIAGHTITRPNRTPGEERLHNQAFKSVDATETATQRQEPSGKTVGHRSNCPQGGSDPCGADVKGKCSKCGASVRDHEAVGKAFGTPADALAGGQTTTINPNAAPGGKGQAHGSPNVEVPKRDHKTSDHHMDLHAGQPGRCPHCGQVLAAISEATSHGQPSRKEKQGQAATFDTVSHKCVGSGLDVLKQVMA